MSPLAVVHISPKTYKIRNGRSIVLEDTTKVLTNRGCLVAKEIKMGDVIHTYGFDFSSSETYDPSSV